MELEQEAILFAVKAHQGQVYHDYVSGNHEPYFWHSIRVSTNVPRDCRIVALMHDILEDTIYEVPDWVSDEDAEAIHVLTRDKKRETYKEYIMRVNAHGGKAVIVKLADLQDNVAHTPPRRLLQRYQWALAVLTDA